MQFSTKSLLRSACFSGVFFFGLIVTACSGSDDSTEQTLPPVPPSSLQAGIYDVTVVEGADDLRFVVSLSSTSNKTVTVDYATSNGTASAGKDYSASSGTLQFAPGEQRKFITVAVLNNASTPTETSNNMQLVLSNPQNAELSKSTATGTIIDKDKKLTDSTFNASWTATGAFTSAAKCGTDCHKADGSTMFYDDEDISPNTQWQHSVMANAFNDPYWQAAVEDEVDSFPHLSGFIEDRCMTCHAPMGHTHAHHSGSELDAENFYRFDTATEENHAREGVSCVACHQIDAGNLGTAASFSGGFIIQGDPLAIDYKHVYGPYGTVLGSNMITQTGHTPIEGTYVTASEICATCHTLYTPALDPDTGTPTGNSFLEQGPYLEWQNSVYASGQTQETQCQQCHMPEPYAGYATSITLFPKSAPSHTPYGQHNLPGGNAHLLEILSEYSTELGIDSSSSEEGFNAQSALTQNFLKTAASIDVSTPESIDNNLEFDVTITNNAGHKMPTAYPSRRMWLHVTVKDKNNSTIFESGKPDSRGYISTDEARLEADCMAGHKLAGFDSSLCYEPHRNVIHDPSQVAIYETVLADTHDNITHILLQAAHYLKDNRIPPAGFTISKAATIEVQTIPAGVAGDEDFNCVSTSEGCGEDSVHYQVNIEGQSGPYTVETRLLYQATQPGFVDGMHNVGDRVNRFKVMYDEVPPRIEVLATATKS